MLRRFFLSTIPASIGLATTAGRSALAAGQKNPSKNSKKRWFPEPEPIVIDDATNQRARQLLDAISRGTFNRSELISQLEANVPQGMFANGSAGVSVVGAPQAMYAFERRITAEQTRTYFRVRYPQEMLTWVVGVDAANRITELCLRRSPNNIIFGITWRNVEY